ncbi:MAG: AAA family ATPase [Ardenticatenaceae bacterium]|nr:AAA family ATPase [Ardenticatenaceae bacterium]
MIDSQVQQAEQSMLDNQQQLTAALGWLKELLRAYLEQKDPPPPDSAGSCPTLAALSTIFDLSPFEQHLLLWCAGIELDSELATLTGRMRGGAPAEIWPTFGLALAVFPDAHWSALTPAAPLRYWRLLELQPGAGVTQSSLRIDERVLHFLTGLQHLDEQLMGFVQPVTGGQTILPSQDVLIRQILTLWSTAAIDQLPAVQLSGPDHDGIRTVASAVAASGGSGLYVLDGNVLPTTPHELDIFQRLWEREAFLSGAILLIDIYEVDLTDAARRTAVRQLCERLIVPFLIGGRERLTDMPRPLVSFEIKRPEEGEQRLLWERTLGAAKAGLNGEVTQLTSQFQLSASAIQNAVWEIRGIEEQIDQAAQLWEACRHQARPALDDLAQRVETAVTWDDLILPKREKAILHDIATQLRHRHTVYTRWGFSRKTGRGLGISALFAGPSGTGKTLAAEVIANALRLDLYKIDLSQVVSKYIGETEKNLAKIFDAAEAGGAILFFDEADALFGKRSEVKDSHDRYANIEVSYLLQRMEAYRGLAILTTNMKQALDGAFLRRLRFIINFRFPDAEAREQIWRRMFPAETPIDNLDWEKLAQLNVTGGNIRSIAVNAAFYAAAGETPVQMGHILRAARAEYDKLDRPLSGTEVRGWL